MKKLFNYLMLAICFIISIIANWSKGLLLFIILTILSFSAYLIKGYDGIAYFYKNVGKSFDDIDNTDNEKL